MSQQNILSQVYIELDAFPIVHDNQSIKLGFHKSYNREKAPPSWF